MDGQTVSESERFNICRRGGWRRLPITPAAPHAVTIKRMEDRAFTEVDLRLMLERATGFRPDVVDNRFVVENPVSSRAVGGSCRTRTNRKLRGFENPRRAICGAARAEPWMDAFTRATQGLELLLVRPRYTSRRPFPGNGTPLGTNIASPSVC